MTKNFKTGRNCVFTSYLEEITPNEEDIKYFICQLEECPETKRIHWQGYVEFKNVKTRKQAQKIIGDEKCHIEKRLGSREQAREYCMKSKTQLKPPIEIGEFGKGQGKRTDLEKVVELVKSETTLKKIMEECPIEYIKYNRGIEKLKNGLTQKKMRKVKTYFLWGKSGIGKTHYVYEKYGIENVYMVNFQKGTTTWFDGYNGEEVIMIDDYYGEISYGTLLKICDKYPYNAPIKGGFVNAEWKRVYITSNDPPETWYPFQENIEGLKRRLNVNPVGFTKSIDEYWGTTNGEGKLYSLRSGVGNTRTKVPTPPFSKKILEKLKKMEVNVESV